MGLFINRQGVLKRSLGIDDDDDLPIDDIEPVDALLKSTGQVLPREAPPLGARPSPFAPAPAPAPEPESPLAGLFRSPKFAARLANALALDPVGTSKGLETLFELGGGKATTGGGSPQIRAVVGPDGRPALQEFIRSPEGGFAPGKLLGEPFITPFTGQSISPETGEIEFVQIPRPLGPSGPGARITRTGVSPAPSAAEREAAGTSLALNEAIEQFRATGRNFQQSGQGFSKTVLQQAVRVIPLRIGKSISGRISAPGEAVLASQTLLTRFLGRELERGRLSDVDIRQIEEVLPTAADLTDPETAALFDQKLTLVKQMVRQRWRKNATLFPGIFTAEDRRDLGLDTQGRETTTRRIRRSSLNRLSPGARQLIETRIQAGEITVIED